MSVTVRVLNRDVPAEQVKITIEQNKIGSIRCSIPMVDFIREYEAFTAARNAMRYTAISVYQDGTLIRSGVVKEVLPAELGKLPGYGEIVAEDEFGWLGLIWSKHNAHYQDTLLTAALADLLTYTTDWEVGDTSTMVDENATISVNLRSKERLWPQIVSAVEATPQAFIRYGGINPVTGRKKLDIGKFGEQDDGRYAFQEVNLYDSTVKRTPNEVLAGIRPTGGKAGNRIVKLNDSITEDAGFPILTDAASGQLYVSNSAITNGALISRKYEEVRTNNEEPPTNDEIQECRQQLYSRTVRDLQAAAEDQVLELEMAAKALPEIGQQIRVRGIAEIPTYDLLTGQPGSAMVEDILDYYRITKIELDFSKSSGKAFIDDPFLQTLIPCWMVNLECTTGLEMANYDTTEYLAKQVQRQDGDEPLGAGIGLGGTYRVTVQHSGVSSDCTRASEDGKVFEFAFDPEPSEAVREVAYTIVTNDNNALYSVIQEPDTSNPLQLCVSGPGGAAWSTGSDVTLTVEYVFYT